MLEITIVIFNDFKKNAVFMLIMESIVGARRLLAEIKFLNA